MHRLPTPENSYGFLMFLGVRESVHWVKYARVTRIWINYQRSQKKILFVFTKYPGQFLEILLHGCFDFDDSCFDLIFL